MVTVDRSLIIEQHTAFQAAVFLGTYFQTEQVIFYKGLVNAVIIVARYIKSAFIGYIPENAVAQYIIAVCLCDLYTCHFKVKP